MEAADYHKRESEANAPAVLLLDGTRHPISRQLAERWLDLLELVRQAEAEP